VRILIADDDRVAVRLVEGLVTSWGHEVVTASDGEAAWQHLSSPDHARIAIIDWMMPGVDGLEVCRRVRSQGGSDATHIILLTARHDAPDIVAGFDAGADDYMVKPFNGDELRARVHVGVRIVELQQRLAAQVAELKETVGHVKRLHGLLPICSYCKKIRGDRDYWEQLEEYLADRTDAQFSHAICPGCYAQFVTPELERC
jgi:DNA-binding response OmpR family regulator